MLDFIVERKRVDDLRSSIRDNRYRDQKLRLLVFILIQMTQYFMVIFGLFLKEEFLQYHGFEFSCLEITGKYVLLFFSLFLVS